MNVPTLLFSRRAASASSICLSCRRSLRQFTASARAPFATSFQSYPLQPPATTVNLPTRDIDGSSVTVQPPAPTPLPKVHETRPPPRQHAQPQTQVAPEAPAPTPAPTQTTPPPAPSTASTSSATAKPAPSARPRSRLRAPRKAAMKLTPAAVEQLRTLLARPDPKLIKVGVRNRGCSGLAYHLEYIDKAGAFDEAVEQDGVTVLVDSKALFSIIGSEMDWVEDKLSQKFVFRNPNIKEQCGCGESFMV